LSNALFTLRKNSGNENGHIKLNVAKWSTSGKHALKLYFVADPTEQVGWRMVFGF
jgi:hypothetical protein